MDYELPHYTSPNPYTPCLPTQEQALNTSADMLSRRRKWVIRGGNFAISATSLDSIWSMHVLANSNVCVIKLYCYLSGKVYTTTTASTSSYGTQSVKRITTITLSGISLYRTSNTAETLVLKLTFCAAQMFVSDLVHQHQIDQTVNRSSSVTMGQSFASRAKCLGTSRASSLLSKGTGWFFPAGKAGRA
jgi:hypothetical protein